MDGVTTGRGVSREKFSPQQPILPIVPSRRQGSASPEEESSLAQDLKAGLLSTDVEFQKETIQNLEPISRKLSNPVPFIHDYVYLMMRSCEKKVTDPVANFLQLVCSGHISQLLRIGSIWYGVSQDGPN